MALAGATGSPFTRPDTAVAGWPGLPHPDEAVPVVIAAYLGAYGPSTPDIFDVADQGLPQEVDLAELVRGLGRP
jgi:hypothetical protein